MLLKNLKPKESFTLDREQLVITNTGINTAKLLIESNDEGYIEVLYKLCQKWGPEHILSVIKEFDFPSLVRDNKGVI